VIEDTELRETLRATAEKAALPTEMPQPMRRKVRARRTRTIGVTFLVAVALLVGGFQGIRSLTLDDAAPEPPADRPDAGETTVVRRIDQNIRDVTPDVAPPKVPYLIDLKTRDMTPLPESITQSLATGRRSPPYIAGSRLAASPDGSSLAFVGEASDGTRQIFIADIDGTGVRQVTHDPTGATEPAWSPNGTRVAYVGYGSGEIGNLFVVDVATGESTQITADTTYGLYEPQFTPDGQSLVYTDASVNEVYPEFRGCCGGNPVVRTVPVAGGESTLLIGSGEGLGGGANASMSPDGSLMTFVGGGYHTSPGDKFHSCDRCRLVADADGNYRRVIRGWQATPSGTWSPDSTRIVLARDPEPPFRIMVVDAVTGEAAMVADRPATGAIWVDDDTLLIDV
jgi:Tol biopolymer transport system component